MIVEMPSLWDDSELDLPSNLFPGRLRRPLSGACGVRSLRTSCRRLSLARARLGWGGRWRACRTPHLQGARDDSLEHLTCIAGLRRPIRPPHVGILFGEDVGKVAAALHAEGSELGDVDGAGPVIAMLDEKPRSIAAA